jgi:mRNA interferase YafQ
MRRIEITAAFRRDFKREKRSGKATDFGSLVSAVISALARDEALPGKNRDHELTGDWRDHRECHLKPDLLLICRKPDANTLQLVRMGSHNKLFN